MSDDLVKRLRRSWDVEKSIMSQTGLWMREREEAAERIEQLAKHALRADATCEQLEDKLAECEARLEKAVEVAEKSVKWLRLYGADVHREAATLGEIKGSNT